MKKNILLVALALLATCELSAQTALYKKFVELPSITATCIENYPIGNKTTAPLNLSDYPLNVSELISSFFSSITLSRYCPYWFFIIGFASSRIFSSVIHPLR